MPSNDEYIAQITDMANKLGKTDEVETEGLNNAELAALAKELRAEMKEAEGAGAADAVAKKEQTQKAKASQVQEKPTGLRVAPGKSITCKRGIVHSEQNVEDKDFVGGAETVKTLLDKGYLVK